MRKCGLCMSWMSNFNFYPLQCFQFQKCLDLSSTSWWKSYDFFVRIVPVWWIFEISLLFNYLITSDNFINHHVTSIANVLYNPQPDIPREILICDYLDEASYHRSLNQSYSINKSRDLLKYTLIVGTDGYMVDIFGPHFSDYYNNEVSSPSRCR